MAAKVLAGWQHGRAKQVPTARRHQGHTKSDAHKTTLVAAAINGAETVGTPQAVMREDTVETKRVNTVECCSCIAISEWTGAKGIDVRPLLTHMSCHLTFGFKMWTGLELHALEPAGAAVKAGADCACRGPHGNGHSFLNSQRIFTILCLSKR